MASSRREIFLRPSVLDRLMMPPDSARAGQQVAIGVQELRDAVLRDLDWLLNTRHSLPRDFEGLPEVKASLLNYGMPDFSAASAANKGDLASIARTIEELIRRFEPRLRPSSVKVTHVQMPADSGQKTLGELRPHFRIDAVLHVDPVNEPVSFDTEVDFESTRISVIGQH